MLPLGIGAQGGQRSGVSHRFGSASLFPIIFSIPRCNIPSPWHWILECDTIDALISFFPFSLGLCHFPHLASFLF